MSTTRSENLGLPLERVTSYMASSGWARFDEDERTSLWAPITRRTPELVQVVLPISEGYTDYDDRIGQALRALSYVESRLVNNIVDDIVLGPADNISVRLTPETPSGEAPLETAQSAVTALRNYVVGSAAALDAPSLVLPPRRPSRAEEYAQVTRLSTSAGSFVLNLALPLGEPDGVSTQPEDQPELVAVTPLPYGRRVSDRMIRVVQNATKLAEQVSSGDESLAAFGRPVESAANATELAALAALGMGVAERGRYDLHFSQSPVATFSLPLEPVRLAVTPAVQHVFEDAAEYLRTKQPRSGVTVSGLVVRLTRQGNLGPGDIVIQGIDDDSGTARRFRTNLGEEQYDQAIRAHRHGLEVRASGDIEVRGTQRYLRPLTSFAVTETLYDD